MGRVVALGPRFINSNTYAIGSKFFCCHLCGIANRPPRLADSCLTSSSINGLCDVVCFTLYEEGRRSRFHPSSLSRRT